MEDHNKAHKSNGEDVIEVTAVKDKEIGPLDSNFPLLKKFRETAPGTFKHSQSLTSMVENVCAAINMEPTVLKLAATYHDVGKMWAPEVFTENQSGTNIHDTLSHEQSYSIITRHVSDSVIIMLEHNFPREVMRIVSEHHGTCVLRSISEQAKEKNPNVSENLFRYHTPRPSSLESLILMLCDCMEATSRSIYVDQKRERIDPNTLVLNMMQYLQDDGQFDNVSIMLGVLTQIKKAVTADVSGSFQKRTAYKGDDNLGKER